MAIARASTTPSTTASRSSTTWSTSSPAARWSRSRLRARASIDGCRQLIGATDPLAAAPGSIRADLAQTIGRNLVHGSDSAASADRELAIFFEDKDFVSRRHDLERWIKE